MLTEALICYAAVALIMARATYDKDHAAEVWFFSLIWPILVLIGFAHMLIGGGVMAICLPLRVFALIRPRLKTRKPTPTIGVTKF